MMAPGEVDWVQKRDSHMRSEVYEVERALRNHLLLQLEFQLTSLCFPCVQLTSDTRPAAALLFSISCLFAFRLEHGEHS